MLDVPVYNRVYYMSGTGAFPGGHEGALTFATVIPTSEEIVVTTILVDHARFDSARVRCALREVSVRRATQFARRGSQ